MNEIDIALICKTLSDSNRIKILSFIANKEMCACKILDKLDISQSTLSYHMAILSDSGLIKTRKEGKWSYYSINKNTYEKFKNYFDELIEV